MIEKIRQNPEPHFEKGMSAKLREDVPETIRANFADFIQPGMILRVLSVMDTPQYGNVAWLGPLEIPQKNVEDFDPGKTNLDDPRYHGVFSITTDHILPVHN